MSRVHVDCSLQLAGRSTLLLLRSVHSVRTLVVCSFRVPCLSHLICSLLLLLGLLLGLLLSLLLGLLLSLLRLMLGIHGICTLSTLSTLSICTLHLSTLKLRCIHAIRVLRGVLHLGAGTLHSRAFGWSVSHISVYSRVR
ncbi:uncharacterized protein BCR38DRAFT_435847 [Pseudomassariella vexata]|uniref:Uncharacterized protein n=1 Tax=Pseudomassariella vexata TaxID=1141098 RepID=A0A1Y2DV14_9PEZI|nr:uncharacterized protein BCR38DRAFT_435847 [Pseudomassariella vexata]ORY63087.1 hypothetical protein BCR38DRAFT_435847 [Pseudomassariella vexata]